MPPHQTSLLSTTDAGSTVGTVDVLLTALGKTWGKLVGGNVLEIEGKPVAGENTIMGEYPALYARMADLVRNGNSEVDLAPMIHVADALTLGERITTAAFDF